MRIKGTVGPWRRYALYRVQRCWKNYTVAQLLSSKNIKDSLFAASQCEDLLPFISLQTEWHVLSFGLFVRQNKTFLYIYTLLLILFMTHFPETQTTSVKQLQTSPRFTDLQSNMWQVFLVHLTNASHHPVTSMLIVLLLSTKCSRCLTWMKKKNTKTLTATITSSRLYSSMFTLTDIKMINNASNHIVPNYSVSRLKSLV